MVLLRNHDNAQSTESITYKEVQLGIGEGIGAYLCEFTLPFFELGWVNLAASIACHSQHQRAPTTTTQEAPNTKTSLKENHQQPREPLQPPPRRRTTSTSTTATPTRPQKQKSRSESSETSKQPRAAAAARTRRKTDKEAAAERGSVCRRVGRFLRPTRAAAEREAPASEWSESNIASERRVSSLRAAPPNAPQPPSQSQSLSL